MRLLISFVLLVAAGCGSGSPYDYVKVSGKVTYEDGSPIPGSLRLHFASQDAPAVEGAVPRPALALVNSQGEFDAVTSYKFGDGLIPGKHKVAIDAGGNPNTRPAVPKEYTDVSTTPLVIDTDDSPLEIKVPKPQPGRQK